MERDQNAARIGHTEPVVGIFFANDRDAFHDIAQQSPEALRGIGLGKITVEHRRQAHAVTP